MVIYGDKISGGNNEVFWIAKGALIPIARTKGVKGVCHSVPRLFSLS